MKLNRSTLRRLIKEEMAREVEAAMLDETVGGYGSPEGRAESDENFDAAVQTLMSVLDVSRELAAKAVTALRGGAASGDTWHSGLNVDSPDAGRTHDANEPGMRPSLSVSAEEWEDVDEPHVEGVETSGDPLAEVGSFDRMRSGVIPQDTIGIIMDMIGPEKWISINRDMQKAGGTVELWNLADALGQYPELVAYLDEQGLLGGDPSFQAHEGEAIIDEDEEVGEAEEVDEAEYQIGIKPGSVKYRDTSPTRMPPGKPATGSDRESMVSIPPEPASENITRPGSLLEVLEERIENLSEVNSIEQIGGFCADRLGKLSGIEED